MNHFGSVVIESSSSHSLRGGSRRIWVNWKSSTVRVRELPEVIAALEQAEKTLNPRKLQHQLTDWVRGLSEGARSRV